MDIGVQHELTSVLQAWGRGSYTFHDFIQACDVKHVEILDMHVEDPIVGRLLYVFRCVPRGRSAPITLLKTFKG